MSAFASSSRYSLTTTIITRSTQPTSRSVMHHARPPRVPILPGPHNPKQPLPTSGTSHSQTSRSSPPKTFTQENVSKLSGTNLTFHYSPPPSAPSFTTGAVPDLLKWVHGEQLHMTGEERAPKRKERAIREGAVEWDEAMQSRIRELRTEGASRKEIANYLDIPLAQQHYISGVVTLSPEQVAAKDAELAEQKSKWGYNKRLAKEMRAKRKDFW